MDWYKTDGVLFIDSKVLDDTNMPGTSLGIRRIQCGRKDLLKLKKAYPDLVSILKSPYSIFIDSNGVPFKYTRTITSPLKHYQVERIERKDTCSVVVLKGSLMKFSIPRPPYGDPRYVRILEYKGSPWLIYDFVVNKGKDSFRRV
jgi:hypothetical protein